MLPHTHQVVVPAPGRDAQPFRAFVERHKRSVYYLALDLTGNHHDAEDLSQEVFIKAYRGLPDFRGEAQVHTWLYRITVNTFLNKQRKKALAFMRLREDFSDEMFEQHEASTPESRMTASALQWHVERALQQLSSRERSAFVLRHRQELALKEVAEAMGVAEGTVKSLLHRAIRKLREALAFYREDMR